MNLNLIRQVSARYLEAICIVDVKFWGWGDLSKEKYVEESKDSWILNGNVQCKKKKRKKLNQISLFGSSFKRAAALFRDDHSVLLVVIHLNDKNSLGFM